MFEFIISVSGWLEYFNINERNVKKSLAEYTRNGIYILIGVL